MEYISQINGRILTAVLRNRRDWVVIVGVAKNECIVVHLRDSTFRITQCYEPITLRQSACVVDHFDNEVAKLACVWYARKRAR